MSSTSTWSYNCSTNAGQNLHPSKCIIYWGIGFKGGGAFQRREGLCGLWTTPCSMSRLVLEQLFIHRLHFIAALFHLGSLPCLFLSIQTHFWQELVPANFTLFSPNSTWLFINMINSSRPTNLIELLPPNTMLVLGPALQKDLPWSREHSLQITDATVTLADLQNYISKFSTRVFEKLDFKLKRLVQ